MNISYCNINMQIIRIGTGYKKINIVQSLLNTPAEKADRSETITKY